MNNYEKMLLDACRRFTSYDMAVLARRPGVEDRGAYLKTDFLGEMVLLEKAEGHITVGECAADFGQTLSVLDWLCDRKENARAAGEYCTVGSLPGVYVGGSGLVMSADALAKRIDAAPEKFRKICNQLGGREVALGDLGYCIPVFCDLSMCLKFYFGDEEFPPQLTFLWDRNILQFVRYETVYYIAGCLQKRLLKLLQEKP